MRATGDVMVLGFQERADARPLDLGARMHVRQLLKLTPTTRDDAANILAAHEEIRGTIELKTIGGAVAKGDAAMLGGVLDLRSLQVLDIMVHRTKMQTIDIDDPAPKVVDEVMKSQHTRIPLWKDEPDNIVGVLHTKDLLVALARIGWDVAKLVICGAGTALIAYGIGSLPKRSAAEVSRGITATVYWATLFVLVVHLGFAFFEFDPLD